MKVLELQRCYAVRAWDWFTVPLMRTTQRAHCSSYLTYYSLDIIPPEISPFTCCMAFCLTHSVLIICVCRPLICWSGRRGKGTMKIGVAYNVYNESNVLLVALPIYIKLPSTSSLQSCLTSFLLWICFFLIADTTWLIKTQFHGIGSCWPQSWPIRYNPGRETFEYTVKLGDKSIYDTINVFEQEFWL